MSEKFVSKSNMKTIYETIIDPTTHKLVLSKLPDVADDVLDGFLYGTDFMHETTETAIDAIVEGYYKEADGQFYEEDTYTTLITPEAGKIYVDLGAAEFTAYRYDTAQTSYNVTETAVYTPATGKLYVDIVENMGYIWNGSAYESVTSSVEACDSSDIAYIIGGNN